MTSSNYQLAFFNFQQIEMDEIPFFTPTLSHTVHDADEKSLPESDEEMEPPSRLEGSLSSKRKTSREERGRKVIVSKNRLFKIFKDSKSGESLRYGFKPYWREPATSNGCFK